MESTRVRDHITSLGQGRVLMRAVVVEVLNDLNIYTPEQRAHLTLGLLNPEHFITCPRNSATVELISDSTQRKANSSKYICYPFFPPHMCLPLKAGEQVWVIAEQGNLSPESTQNPEANLLYWMCRISGPLHVDDVNFTHLDRRYNTDGRFPHPDEPEDAEGTLVNNNEAPGFMNGGGFQDRTSLNPANFPNGYVDIFDSSISNQSFTFESVPRFTKRPGDLVIQGSNNTLICLGEDRGWNAETAEALPDWSASDASTANPESEMWLEEPAVDPNERSYAGAIDIVAGRGRYRPAEASEDPELTSCRIIENTMGFEETDKNPLQFATSEDDLANINDNPVEGDSDLISDASRIYVSMNSNPDLALGLQYPPVPPVGDSNEGEEIELPEGTATVFMKSDEIRIIARQTEEASPAGTTPEIKGSIKIIKEGVLDSEEGDGQASIILQPDGVIMIDGPKIVIGSGIEKDNGEGAQISLGLSAEEPIVLGNQLNERLDMMCDQMDLIIELIDQLVNDYSLHTHPTGVGPSAPSVEATSFAGTHSPNSQSAKDDIENESREKFFLIKSKIGKTL